MKYFDTLNFWHQNYLSKILATFSSNFFKYADQHLSIGVPYKDILFVFIKFYKKTICLKG